MVSTTWFHFLVKSCGRRFNPPQYEWCFGSVDIGFLWRKKTSGKDLSSAHRMHIFNLKIATYIWVVLAQKNDLPPRPSANLPRIFRFWSILKHKKHMYIYIYESFEARVGQYADARLRHGAPIFRPGPRQIRRPGPEGILPLSLFFFFLWGGGGYELHMARAGTSTLKVRQTGKTGGVNVRGVNLRGGGGGNGLGGCYLGGERLGRGGGGACGLFELVPRCWWREKEKHKENHNCLGVSLNQRQTNDIPTTNGV